MLGDIGQRRVAVDDEAVVADDADDAADIVVVRGNPVDPAVTVDDVIALAVAAFGYLAGDAAEVFAFYT